MSDIMIDIETMGINKPCILTIGAIRFNRTKNVDKDKTYLSLPEKDIFYRRITLQSCLDVGLTVDTDTVKWWMSQDRKVLDEAMFSNVKVSLSTALTDLHNWVNRGDRVWGNGSSFDITILDEAYFRCGMNSPWSFWNVRDLRTLYDVGGIKSKDVKKTSAHHALHDCYYQIVGFQMALKKIKY